jgi:hypothetical protein
MDSQRLAGGKKENLIYRQFPREAQKPDTLWDKQLCADNKTADRTGLDTGTDLRDTLSVLCQLPPA